MEENGRWYVVHTYSGYENKVMANIMKIVENRNMKDVIFEVKVPIEEQVEIKNAFPLEAHEQACLKLLKRAVAEYKETKKQNRVDEGDDFDSLHGCG